MQVDNLTCTHLAFFEQDVDLDYVAKVTHGFSGADLTEICQRVRTFYKKYRKYYQSSCT